MTRLSVILFGVLFSVIAMAQGDAQVRSKAATLFDQQSYLEALPLYSQLVSLEPSDRDLNYRFGTCLLFSGDDKGKAIGHLKFAVQDPSIPADAWYWLGRAYHLNYQFKDAQAAYQRYQGTGSKKELEGFTVASLDKQCRNGQQLLNNLKEITVRNKVEAEDTEFFRFYELDDIGGRIVVLPEELKSNLDKKSKERFLVYLPTKGGAIYYSSYGRDGKTGRDIYRTEVMPDGTFASPIKLAGYVNTDQDEDFAFLHPDGKSFYFSSKGHNSMGGYDVFRSAYDKGLDTFGPPENLDFAVNTPDDELFYMTDAENKEACFASGRDSEQGKLHVYRVGTAQVPLVITVLRGTFASSFDPDDRKAHIMVEDAVTREKVADVRTDMNGAYVLALPRSGKFRYLVECGPSGRTHVGLVDVPRTTTPRAYRQELELSKQGDIEKLTIRNYFDAPLDEDMMALMMDEIKRRAKLDVTSEAPIVAKAEELEPTSNDPLTQAGFSGDITEAKAVEMANAEVAALAKQVSDLDIQSKQAYGLAIDAAAEADRAGRASEALVEKVDASMAEEERNAIMVQAAQERQRSREANLRARAAYSTGQELETEVANTQRKQTQAKTTATQLASAIDSKQSEATLTQLRALKEILEAKSGPQGERTVTERSRQTLAQQETEASRSFSIANSKRTEENEFTDRIARAKRERDETKNKSRKEELSRQITEQEQQLAYLHDEVEGAFTKAKELEQQTAVMRGQHDLTNYLTSTERSNPATELNKEQVLDLGRRIAGNDSRIASIQVDERYDAQVVAQQADVEARSFNWEMASAAEAVGQRQTTQTQQRNTTNDALASANRPTTTTSEPTPGSVRYTEIQNVPATRDPEDLASASSGVGRTSDQDAGEDANSGAPNTTGSGESSTADGSAGSANSTIKAPGSVEDRTSEDRTAPTFTQNAGNDEVGNGSIEDVTSSTGSATGTLVQEEGHDAVAENTAGSEGIKVDPSDRSVRTSAEDNGENVTIAGSTVPISTEDQTASVDPVHDLSVVDTTDPELDAFILENRKAELEQALGAEKNSQRRVDLQEQLTNVDAEMAELKASEVNVTNEVTEDLAFDGVDMGRLPLTFYPETKDEDIVTMVFKQYEVDKQRLEQMEEGEVKADGRSGLELMLADSLRGELVRQAAILELSPEQGDRILPKMERLRMMREMHIQSAELIQQEHQAWLEKTTVAEMPGLARQTRTHAYAPGQDPVADRFISVDPDPQEIFSSKIEHRSKKVNEAVADKEADLARMHVLDVEIDSIEASMPGLPRKEFDKLRRSADKLIDERMILRSDLGQRSAYLMKEEWRTANDSLKKVEKLLAPMGLAPDENLVLMAKGMHADARMHFNEAEALRKEADRSMDIMVRDSLFRTAYGLELKALSDMDRAITVKTYLLGGEFQRGEALAYDVIARRVLEIDEPLLASVPTSDRVGGTENTTATSKATLDGTPTPEPGSTGSVDQGDEIPAVSIVRSTVGSGEAATTQNDQPSSDGSSEASNSIAQNDTGRTTTAVSAVTDDATETERARIEAQELADRTEAARTTKNSMPAKRYEDFLKSESVILQQGGLDPDLDPLLLENKADQAVKNSASLEARSLELADLAVVVEDSATRARKRDKEELAVLAVRMRAESDSLHIASLDMAEEARSLEMQKRDAQQAKVLRDRLVKYYYLSPEEQAMVVGDEDESRYFQAKARALEQYDAAKDAEESARIDRELAKVMLNEAGIMDRERLAGRLSPAQADVKREVLRTRADELLAHADSLTNISARLRGAAAINEGQAGVMLQGLPADRSTETMALEMRTRRTESLLAETRDVGLEGRTPIGTNTNGSPSTTAPSGTVPERPTSRAITAPFGTDGQRTTSPVERPIMEVEELADASAFPVQLVNDIFALRPAEDRAPAPIPMDARMPEGLVFKVQIGAFRKEISEAAFSDMTPVMGEHANNGFIRYTAGLFTGFDQAAIAKDKVRDRGYRDAFVVAYRDGVRIPLGVAMRESRENAVEETVLAANTPQRTSTATSNTEAQPSERSVAQEPSNTTVATESSSTIAQQVEGNTVLEPSRTNPIAEVRPPAIIQAPLPVVPSVTATATSSSEDLLAKYPTTAAEIVSSFTPASTSYYDATGAAPADQVEAIRGLFYTVQVGVYSKPVALGKLFNITPLNTERTATDLIRYTTGRYSDTEQARVRKDEAVVKGVKDAFITAYLNGKRIPMQEAAALLQRFGPEILARP